VRLDKGDFQGREALRRIKEEGVGRRLCCLTFTSADDIALGKEPVLAGDRVLGYVTSANYGYSVGKYIAYGYLPVEYAAEGTEVEVEYFGVRHKAVVSAEPLYDPHMEKLKA
jgi:glycine cleavage system aminomethyltransferase T